MKCYLPHPHDVQPYGQHKVAHHEDEGDNISLPGHNTPNSQRGITEDPYFEDNCFRYFENETVIDDLEYMKEQKDFLAKKAQHKSDLEAWTEISSWTYSVVLIHCSTELEQ